MVDFPTLSESSPGRAVAAAASAFGEDVMQPIDDDDGLVDMWMKKRSDRKAKIIQQFL